MSFDLPIHPIIVHFPIALLIVGFLMDVAGLALRKTWLTHAALLLLVIGALGTVAATRSGEADEDAILETPAIEETLETHEDSGKMTMWFFLGITVVRAGLAWWKKFPPALHWIFVVAWLAGLGLLVRTAYYGGEMVYHHGAGTPASRAAGEHGRGGGSDDD